MIAGHLITWAATQHGARTAVVFGEQRFSHAEIETRSNRFAQAALALGLQPGERLAVLLDNSVESLDSGFGAEKAGLTYVALNARHTRTEHLEILADAGASAVLVGRRHGELATAFVQAAGRELPRLRHVLGLDVDAPGVTDWPRATAAAPDRPPAIEIGPEHLMRIAYTSGTTGRPKGVAYTLERWQARLANHFLAREYGLSVDDAMLHVGPLTHAAGVYLFPCFLRGARNVVLDQFDPAAVLAAIERERITQLMLVPTMMLRLVEAIEGGARGDWS